MVLFTAEFCGRLDGVQSVAMQTDAQWCFQVACRNCGEVHGNEVYVNAGEIHTGKHQKHGKNFVLTCRGCHRENSLSFVPNSLHPYQSSERFQAVAQFDCRGLELLQWLIRDGFTVISEAGTEFRDQNLSEGDWSEYDEEAGAAVSVFEAAVRIRKE